MYNDDEEDEGVELDPDELWAAISELTRLEVFFNKTIAADYGEIFGFHLNEQGEYQNMKM